MRDAAPPARLLAAVALALLAGALAAPAHAADVEGLAAAQEAVEAGRQDLERTVRALLRADDDRSMCWGATYAREHSLQVLAPELTEILRLYRDDAERVSFRTLYAALDALLHLEAVLELDDLLPFARGGRGQAAAVALCIRGRNPHVMLPMFEVYDRSESSWGAAWMALGNALADGPTPGFFARVLAGLEVELRVTVTDSRRMGGGGSSVGIGCGDGRYPQVEGYPRVWAYRLTVMGGEGDVLLADGPTPVFLRREEVLRGHGSTSRDLHRVEGRFAWIAALFRQDVARLPLHRRESAHVMWTDAAALRAEVSSAKAKVRASYALLVERLLGGRALTEEEARSLPDLVIHVTLNDQRQDKTEPLPEDE